MPLLLGNVLDNSRAATFLSFNCDTKLMCTMKICSTANSAATMSVSVEQHRCRREQGPPTAGDVEQSGAEEYMMTSICSVRIERKNRWNRSKREGNERNEKQQQHAPGRSEPFCGARGMSVEQLFCKLGQLFAKSGRARGLLALWQ